MKYDLDELIKKAEEKEAGKSASQSSPTQTTTKAGKYDLDELIKKAEAKETATTSLMPLSFKDLPAVDNGNFLTDNIKAGWINTSKGLVNALDKLGLSPFSDKRLETGNQNIESFINKTNEANQAKGKVADFSGKVIQAGTQMVPGIAGALASASFAPVAAGAATVAGLQSAGMGATLFPVMFGNSYRDAINRGLSEEEATAYAAKTAAKETAIESLAGPIGGVGTKLVGKVASKALPNLAQGLSKVTSSLPGKIASSALGEGSEEGISYETQRRMDNAAFNENTPFSGKEMAQQMAVGGTLGGIMGGGVHTASTLANRIRTAKAPTTPP